MKPTEDYGEQAVRRAASAVAASIQTIDPLPRRIGIVLGSGLGHAADVLTHVSHIQLACSEIPGMPLPRVDGHAGHLIIGNVAGATVFILKGRVHYYEGHSLAAVTFATRVLYQLGVTQLILTNAAGGIRPEFQPGHLMLISGHIRWPAMALSCFSTNPQFEDVATRAVSGVCRLLHDEGMPPVGWPHFDVWSLRLRQLAAAIPSELPVHQGVYALMSGPNYETPAEVRAARFLGADAVGMSTVSEAITAAQRGMEILGVSCITNIACGLSDEKLNHADVTQIAAAAGRPFSRWLWDAIHRIVSCETDLSATGGGS